MNHKEIESIACEIVTAKIKGGEIVKMEWAVKELIQCMGEITGDGADFHIIAADYYAWRIVKSTVNKIDAATSAANQSSQMDLSGFDKIQEAYTVKRNGSISLVPVELMTPEEREERASLFEKFAKGLISHARELRRYNENLNQMQIEYPSPIEP